MFRTKLFPGSVPIKEGDERGNSAIMYLRPVLPDHMACF